MKIIYQFVTGEVKEIEVDERWHNEIKELDRQLYNNNQKERRRHCSVDLLRDEYDLDLKDGTIDILQDCISHSTWDRLLTPLNDRQKDLVRRVFFNGENLTNIAKELGISRQSAKESFDYALKKIKKLLD